MNLNSLNRKDLFLRAARGQDVERVPVWIMRQAGRYLPEYQELHKRHTFLEMCRSPELAAEVSLQPFRRLGVDAVIVFSDILVVAEAMGLCLEVGPGGPVLTNPVRDSASVRALADFDPEESTRYVGDAIRLLCRELGPDVPILGFAAAPWTLACYMAEGRGNAHLPHIKKMLFSAPALLHELLEKIARATARYLKAQIAAGAAAVQLFDTWAGELSRSDFDEFALPAIRQLVEWLAPGTTPVIYYSKGSAHLLPSLARTGATVQSLDWRVDLAEARRVLGPRIALQGNVEPAVLLGSKERVGEAVRAAIDKTQGMGHILNLGHGILPMTPVENALAFVQEGQSVPHALRSAQGRAE